MRPVGMYVSTLLVAECVIIIIIINITPIRLCIAMPFVPISDVNKKYYHSYVD
jgi:hypothetical protein